MRPACAALVIVIALAGSAVRAAPPTVTPSPGYDARLQEQRAAAAASSQSATSERKPVAVADYAGSISAYRRANRMPAVTLDAKLNAMALKQAQAMSATGSVSHSAGGSFFTRIAPLKKQRAAENIGAGFIAFAEMLKQWENSPGHRENLLMPGAKRVGVAFVDNPKSPYRRFWAMVITD